MKFVIFLKSSQLFKFLLPFLFINKTLLLNSLKTRTAMNSKISVFVICVEVIIHLLYNLHNCTFNVNYINMIGLNKRRKKESINAFLSLFNLNLSYSM